MLIIGTDQIGDLRDPELLAKHRVIDIDPVLADMDLPADRSERIIGLLVEWSSDSKKRPPFPSWEKAIQRANTEVGSGAIFASVLQPSATTSTKLTTTKLQATWGNCGKTGAYILAGLAQHVADLNAAVQRAPQQPARLSFGRSLLANTLTDIPRSGDIRLLDCSLTSLHTFLVEIHPDGRRYLHQGYQGSYSCTWWEGTEEAGLSRDKLNQPDIEQLTTARDRYGLGRRIADDNYHAFVKTLDAALTADNWGTFTALWGGLPFCPTSGEMDNMKTRTGTALPVLEITSYTVALPTEPPLLVNAHGSICAAVIPARIS